MKPLPERGQASLEFNLREYKDAPALTNQLSALEQACLRLRDWLVQWPTRAEDLVVSAHFNSVPWARDLDFELTSSDQGFALLCSSATPPHTLRYAVLATTNAATLFCGARQRQWQSPKLNLQLKQFLDIGPTQAPEDQPQFNLSIGFGFGSGEPGPPMVLTLKLAPVAFLHAAHTPERTATIQNGLVTITHVGDDPHTNQVQFEQQTGRLLQLTSSGQETGVALRLSFQPGQLQRTRQQILAAAASFANQYQARKPLSSALGFLLADLIHSPVLTDALAASGHPPAPALAALDHLLAGGVLEPLDRLSLGSTSAFQIPKRPPETPAAAPDSAFSEIAGFLLAQSDVLFPHGSWLWSIAREAAFTVSRRNPYTVPELNRVVARTNTGPVACLAAAYFLGMIHADAESVDARRSLPRRFSPAGFRQDWQPLFTGDSVLSQCLQQLASSLGTAKPEDVEALAALLPPAEAELLRGAARALRERPEQPAAEALTAPFDRYFVQALTKRFGL